MKGLELLTCDFESLNLNWTADALVLLFKHERANDGGLAEPRNIPNLEGLCPGLKRLIPITNRKPLEAVLLFENWSLAAKAVIGLWELRLQGGHNFTPELLEPCPNDGDYMESVEKELKQVFLSYLQTLENGSAVSNLKSEMEVLVADLNSLQKDLQRRNNIARFSYLTTKKNNTLIQIQSLAEHLAEYLNALKALELAISSKSTEEHIHWFNDDTSLFRLGNDWTWHQMHSLILRENLRFKERLSLYAKRSDILRHIHNNQVLVLNGETGSGKSTQLAQYIVDAGFIKDGSSVVCTQPRRVAVTTLFNRVTQECKGCSQEPLVGHLTSPAFRIDHLPKMMFVTDHSLLQLCLKDEKLTQFGCVLVDEAHERSLNTDLLLAMLKKCLAQRPDFKVVIMSATVDTELLSTYFGGCIMYQVVGRSFPVDFIYEPSEEDDTMDGGSGVSCSSYVRQVVKMVNSIINMQTDEGDVLAFLTSQADIEWACSQDFGPSSIVLPLHGRLQAAEQQLVFKATSDGRRKIVFATNIAETSLTIPGIKYVVDCGFAKESCVDPKSGMNVLKACWIDKSSATQRAGRAGRTQSGICYRLYSKSDYEAMAPHRTPEILRVHLGVAILKLLALGVQEIESFDFIDTPSPAAISLAMENLCQLGAVHSREGKAKLTSLGWQLVKLGVDPCLGFIALRSLSEGFGREGLVIAGLLTCSGSIFFRVGSDSEKLRSDCLKLRFCHPHGDIFTLLSVYHEWDMVPESHRNWWCVQNSINAKSMRRCRDYVKELECCLRHELGLDVPPSWTWSASNASAHSYTVLRKILLHAMPKNVAVFSGHEHVGYDVVSLQKKACLHPSSSSLVFGEFPMWVVFGNLLCTSREFLTSVTVVEPEWLSEVNVSPPYDVVALEASRMIKTTICNLNSCILGRLSGRNNIEIRSLTSRILQGDNKHGCILEAHHEKQEFHIYATPDLMKRAEMMVDDAIKHEKRWLNRECIEKPIYQATRGKSSPIMLFGAGGEVKEVLMQGEYATVQISCLGSKIDDGELFSMLEKCGDGLASYHRDSTPGGSNKKWGTVTFCSRKGATEAVSLLHNGWVGKSQVELTPCINYHSNEGTRPLFPAIKAILTWPRRQISGYARVCCKSKIDQHMVILLCSGILVNGAQILCRPDRRGSPTEVFVRGLGQGTTEAELRQALQQASGCTLEDVFLLRLPAKDQPTIEACTEALVQEIERFVPSTKFEACLFGSDSNYVAKAEVKFDESEHEGATRAIAHLQGHALSICQPWQIISCKNIFFSTVQCSGPMYSVLKEDISDLVKALKEQNESTELSMTVHEKGCLVRISANSLRAVAICKSAFENLLQGAIVEEGMEEADRKLLFTREGLQMAKAVELQTRTCIMCDKRNQVVRIYGSTQRKNRALSRLVRSLSQLKDRRKCHEIGLRGHGRPPGLMKEIVRKFGVDLVGLSMLVNGATVSLDLRRHLLLVLGSKEDLSKVEERVEVVANALKGSVCEGGIGEFRPEDCGICFCEVEDSYSLVACGHSFCRECIKEQILSATRHREGFPLTCAYPQCPHRLLLADFKVLLTAGQQDELIRSALCAFVTFNGGHYRFCTTPDCPAIYRVTSTSQVFHCGACAARLCTSCHGEFHFGLTCKEYEDFKQDPDLSLVSWRRGKQHVKCCPSCGSTIEKVDGCNHILCNCKAHLCWLCLSPFQSSEDCYSHLQSIHGGYI